MGPSLRIMRYTTEYGVETAHISEGEEGLNNNSNPRALQVK